jgi:hypothetical protein
MSHAKSREAFMSDSFGAVLNDRLGTVTLTDVARKMAAKNENPRNVLSTLSRFRNDDRVPSQKKVGEIAGALGSLHDLSGAEREQLRSELMRAAGHGDPRFSDLRTAARLELSESETRRCLRPECKEILLRNGYNQDKTNRILAAVGASTMKLIIDADKAGEEIEVVELGKLGDSDHQSLEVRANQRAEQELAGTVFDAGRAQISVSGDMSPEQMKVLQNAAEMIKAVLQI